LDGCTNPAGSESREKKASEGTDGFHGLSFGRQIHPKELLIEGHTFRNVYEKLYMKVWNLITRI
jgi:hypothetical protein